MLPHCDFLSINAPMTPATAKWVNAERIAKLPRGAIVVNTARGGLVILLSDFLELRGLETSLAFLPEPAWDVVCIQLLHPDELQPPQSGDWELEDCESGRRANYDLTREAARQYQRHFSDWQEELDRLCDEHNAFFTWVSTGGSLDKDILPHLVDARVVRPL